MVIKHAPVNLQRKETQETENREYCMVVTTVKSWDTDQLVEASEVHNVHHAEGIILSKHGSPANIQACIQAAQGLYKSNETLFPGYHCASLWAWRARHLLKLDHRNENHKQLPRTGLFLCVITVMFCLI